MIDADELIKKCDSPHWCVWMSEIEDAPTIESEPKWIPCSERLPEKECLCLVTIKKKNGGYKVNTELYSYDNYGIGGFWTFDYIVAWMPLPEPYKEVE